MSYLCLKNFDSVPFSSILYFPFDLPMKARAPQPNPQSSLTAKTHN